MAIPIESDAREIAAIEILAADVKTGLANIPPHDRIVRRQAKQQDIEIVKFAGLAEIILGEGRMAANPVSIFARFSNLEE